MRSPNKRFTEGGSHRPRLNPSPIHHSPLTIPHSPCNPFEANGFWHNLRHCLNFWPWLGRSGRASWIGFRWCLLLEWFLNEARNPKRCGKRFAGMSSRGPPAPFSSLRHAFPLGLTNIPFFLLVIFFVKMGVLYGQFPTHLPRPHPPRGQQIIQQTFWQKVFYYLAPTIDVRVVAAEGWWVSWFRSETSFEREFRRRFFLGGRERGLLLDRR